MRILVGGVWRDGFLDYFRPADHLRIEVRTWTPVSELTDLYFIRRRDPRMVLNYLLEIGPRQVSRKVRSRSRERFRNEKWLSFGAGEVLEAPEDSPVPRGTAVAFLAPRHPACV
jgi:hypothetical protein